MSAVTETVGDADQPADESAVKPAPTDETGIMPAESLPAADDMETQPAESVSLTDEAEATPEAGAPTAPSSTSAEEPDPESGADRADGRQGAAGSWPFLLPTVLESIWQQAIMDGPKMMGRQVACALATSLQRSHDAESISTSTGEEASVATEGTVALAALAEHLSPRQQTILLDEANALPDPSHRARVCLLMASHLPMDARRHALRQAWDAALQITTPLEQARVLGAYLAPLRACVEDELPGGRVAETLDLASTIKDPEARLRSLTALAPYLPPTARIAVLLVILDTVGMLSQADGQAAALGAIAPHLLGEVFHRTLTVASRIKTPDARARALTAIARYLPHKLQPRLRAAALEAVATIDNETERAEALAAFAPHLEDMSEGEEEFPILLKRALEIAVGMNRRDARAVALVGLQARLPRHLQGEALAAVNTIPDEHTRAQRLADLAPSLPPDLAVAALAIAHDLRQRDARLLALKALARNMHPKAAQQTWLDALAVALGLPRQFERVLALAELAPNLPDELRLRALTSALTAARSIPKESARMLALATLAPLLEGQLLADALADAHALTQPLERVSALTALIPHLPEGDPQTHTLEEALQAIRAITVEYRRARALANLAPHLPDFLLGEAIAIALDIEDPYDRSSTLVALLPHLDGDVREQITSQAWQAACDILDQYDRTSALAALWPEAESPLREDIVRAALDTVQEIADDYDRASGITVLAPLLTPAHAPKALPQESQVLREAMLAVCQLASLPVRAEALAYFVPHWLKVQPPIVAYALWCEVLPLLSHRSVPHLLSDLTALTPILREIGGETATREAAQVIAQARKW